MASTWSKRGEDRDLFLVTVRSAYSAASRPVHGGRPKPNDRILLADYATAYRP